MDINSIEIHPEFPEKVWVVIEQPPGEKYRMRYNPSSREFIRMREKNIYFERGFRGAYGWIGGLGTPPEDHCDVILLTNKNLKVGSVTVGLIRGIFLKRDMDNKLIAVHEDSIFSKIYENTNVENEKKLLDSIKCLYPLLNNNEGWYGRAEAKKYLMILKNKKYGIVG